MRNGSSETDNTDNLRDALFSLQDILRESDPPTTGQSMIRSMTGFGEASGESSQATIRVELRTVNHRYLNVNARLPNSLNRLEGDLREWLKGPFSRGHINCTVRLEPHSDADDAIAYDLDEGKVRSYLHVFRRLSEEFGVEGTPDLSLIARFADIIVRSQDDATAPEIEPDELRSVVVAAAVQAVEMREEEGKRLQKDLQGRVAAMESALRAIEKVAPDRLVAERNRLREAVAGLIDGQAPDPDRLAQEIALLAERWDINEELVRFRSHNDLFLQLLDGGSEEPVGKRMGFLVQEMHREANTIGSKANSSDISHMVVAIKDEIERLREQVENVE